MAVAATAKIFAAIDSTLSNTLDFSTPTSHQKADLNPVNEFTAGSGSGQINKVFHDQRQLGPSGTEDIDLSGALVDALGVTLAFTAIKAIYVKAAAANTNNVVIGNTAATQFLGPFGAATHTLAVPPGGVFLVTFPGAGWTVGAGATDLLKILNSGAGTGVTYDITFLGS